MRYQLPDNISSVGVGARHWLADADGIITVPDDAGVDVHTTLRTMHSLVPLPDEPEGAVEPAAARDIKRSMLDLLRVLGYVADGRTPLEMLRRKLLGALGGKDAQQQAALDAEKDKGTPTPAEPPPADLAPPDQPGVTQGAA